jgi:dihydrofolate synthase/folylpolyglutamate synthase
VIDTNYIQSIYQKNQSDVKYNLGNIKRLASLFGNPQKDLKLIHITGTNGKGSVAAILESLIIQRSCTVGLFTSPHLVNYNERFRINQKDIDDESLKYFIELILKISKEHNLSPSFFEISTMIAFLYFKNKNIDYGIMEVGLGGRLDATNIVNSKLAIITMIDYDHKRLLGKKKTDIAIEKAGIIKKGTPFFTGEKSKMIRNAIIRKGIENGGKPLNIPQIEILRRNTTLLYQTVDITVDKKSYNNVKFPLIGGHQIENLKIALIAYNYLFGNPSKDNMREGLANVNWFGRMTLLSKNPFIIIDGCHNKSAAKSIGKEIQRIKKTITGKSYLLFGMVKKKPLNFVARELFPFFDKVIVTNFHTERARPLKDYIKYLEKYAKSYTIIDNIDNVYENIELIKNDLLFVTGSLYLLGDFITENN